jgi:hypothetical protein
MKKIAIAFVCCCFCFAASGQNATIVVNTGTFPDAQTAGNAEKQIGWADDNPEDDIVCTQCYAAIELQHYLRKITGSETGFPVVDDDDTPEGNVIIIGGGNTNALAKKFTDRFMVTPEELAAAGPEGYRISAIDQNGRKITLIAGGGRIGTLYGVYDFLHRLGVRWYAPGEVNEEVPAGLPEDWQEINVSQTPAFFTRGFHAWEDRGNPDFIVWMGRNRLNYWCVEQKETALLHKLGIQLVGGGHVLTHYYLNPAVEYPYDHPVFKGDEDKPESPYASLEYLGDKNGDGKLTYFEAHPDWYCLRGGKRSDRIKHDFGDNFCTSNMDAMDEWTGNAVQDLIDGRYKDATIINAWALDVGKWCECENCKALGEPTDRNILLVHHYAQAIKKAQAEGRINRDIRLLFLAYADVIAPPTKPLPENFDYDMCIATYFPIRRNYVYNFDDPASTVNAKYMKHLKGWFVEEDRYYRGQLCIGEYYNVSGYKCLPICFMHTMCNDIPFYYSIGARHFHYMHCTTKNWGNKALTNWQMACQLWNPESDCNALWDDYFNGRYGPVAEDMRAFYRELETMLNNCSELKYGLAGRLNRGDRNLFPNNILKYEESHFDTDDGPDMVEIIGHADNCREMIDKVLAKDLPDRIRARAAMDEKLFTYGERTVRFYDALCRAYAAAWADRKTAARKALGEARELADLLAADTESAKHASSHANAPDALNASRAAGAIGVLTNLLGPADPEKIPLADLDADALTLTGRHFPGGGAAHHGYGLSVFPGRTRVSEDGNYVYGKGGKPADTMKAWFSLEERPEKNIAAVWQGLKCPEPAGGDITGRVLVNGKEVFRGNVPFSENVLSTHTFSIPAGVFVQGENTIEIRNEQAGGRIGNRPWFGIDHIVLKAE